MNKYDHNVCRHQFCIIKYDLTNNCDRPSIITEFVKLPVRIT